MMKTLFLLPLLLFSFVMTGCAVEQKQPYDYTELEKAKPKSILLVMPTNNSVEAKADVSVLAQASIPLAELGYYVYPVALVDDVFKQNGAHTGNDIQALSLPKIHQIFGADAIMYLDIEEYGSSYRIVSSDTIVTLSAKLVDLRTGTTLWQGRTSERTSDSPNNSLIGVLVAQIINSLTDKGYDVAGLATHQLFRFGENGGLLLGPRATGVAARKGL
ncbi:DUF799 domain-containing protein [Pasteurella sp. PK-2025]|uniref:DUF799 domain-containing protein n=1 Tax=Pasteurella sp. PK-2025 TaxID=3413133 RepID=UPI003C75EF97